MSFDIETIKELSPIVAVVVVFVLGYVYSSKNHKEEIRDINEAHQKEIRTIMEAHEREIKQIMENHARQLDEFGDIQKEKTVAFMKKESELLDMFMKQISAKDDRLYSFLSDLGLKIERNTVSVDKLIIAIENRERNRDR
jgi:uncharacterized protein YneF (UPF0154 family)